MLAAHHKQPRIQLHESLKTQLCRMRSGQVVKLAIMPTQSWQYWAVVSAQPHLHLTDSPTLHWVIRATQNAHSQNTSHPTPSARPRHWATNARGKYKHSPATTTAAGKPPSCGSAANTAQRQTAYHLPVGLCISLAAAAPALLLLLLGKQKTRPLRMVCLVLAGQHGVLAWANAAGCSLDADQVTDALLLLDQLLL